MVDGLVDTSGTELVILSEARRYELAEAVRVVQEVTGGADPNDLLGRVKTKTALVERGAELLESSMIIGDNAYDVVPGWLGTPIGTFEEHMKSTERKDARGAGTGPGAAGDEAKTEEELLSLSLLKSSPA